MTSVTTYNYNFKNEGQLDYFLSVITDGSKLPVALPEYEAPEFRMVAPLTVEMDVPNILEELYDRIFLTARKIAA